MTADLSQLRIDRDRPGATPRSALKWAGALAGVALLFVLTIFVLMRRSGGIAVTVAQVAVVGGGGPGGIGITANGYVVARTRASVSSRISGRLARLDVEEGSVVRRGQVMARLDNADYLAAVAQAVADSSRAEAALREAAASRDQLARDLARARELVAKNLEASRTAEDLGSQLAAADARVGVQDAQVASDRLRPPGRSGAERRRPGRHPGHHAAGPALRDSSN